MSKGLGKLQRAILETLEDAKRAGLDYTGASWWSDEPGRVVLHGCDVLLADGVYDLRASLKYLAKRENQVTRHDFVKSSFNASFSRAVKGLIEAGYLLLQNPVPIETAKWGTRHTPLWLIRFQGKLYIKAGRQRRFVKLVKR